MLLISDLDGTVVHSEPLIIASYEEVIRKYGLPPKSPEELRACIGTALSILYLEWGGSAERSAAFYKTHGEFQKENYHLLEFIPDIVEVFALLHQRNVKIAINTNRASKGAEHLLKLARLTPYIDALIGVDNVTKPKPDPEGIHLLMRRFGSVPDNTYMLGDTPIDIQAGKNAGVITIGALFTETSNEKIFNNMRPHHVIRYAEELIPLIGAPLMVD